MTMLLYVFCRNAFLSTSSSEDPRFVVVGGGAGGLAVGSWIRRKYGENCVTIIEPAEVVELHTLYIASICTTVISYIQCMMQGSIKKLNCHAKFFREHD